MVPAGADTFKQIGRPKVALPGQLTAADVVATWKVRGRPRALYWDSKLKCIYSNEETRPKLTILYSLKTTTQKDAEGMPWHVVIYRKILYCGARI